MKTSIILAATLFGCNSDPIGSDTGTDSKSDNGSALAPADGFYTIAATEIDDTCNVWATTFQDSINGYELEITFPDAETATFHWPNPVDCPRNGADVSCSSGDPMMFDDYSPDADAQLMYADSTNLTWETPDLASGIWNINVSCEGTQCAMVEALNEESYPCEIEIGWVLTRTE